VHGFQNACTTIFFENSSVLKDFSGNDGTIVCPKCDSKLGAFKLSGIKCWCDTWIIPGYQIQKFKVNRKVWNVKTENWE
jgi:dual specificity phosphatase 12